MSKEDVAEYWVKTIDWDKTAQELEKPFFTILENEKYAVEWHFLRSPTTGKIGPSKSLRQLLESNRTKVIIHD